MSIINNKMSGGFNKFGGQFDCHRPVISMVPVLAMLTAISACTDRSYVDRFEDRDLMGVVGGKAWNYRYAFVDPTSDTGHDNDYMFIFLPFKPKERCPIDAEIPRDAVTIQVAAPKIKKLTKLKQGSARVLGFITPGKKDADPALKVAKKGRFKLTSIRGDRVVGKLRGRFNSQYWVNGRFRATVCAIAEMER